MISKQEAVEKLVRQYQKHGTLYVAFDFDDTVKNYLDGTPNQEVIDLLKWSYHVNCTLILFTCREGERLKEAMNWCTLQGINFHYANCNPEIVIGGRKPYYNILLDDKAGLNEAVEVLTKTLDRL